MYPIVQFAGIHPASTITLDSDPTTLQLARQTVWGQNFMSRWSPVNGLCLAWPSAAKIVDGGAPPTSEFGTSTLLDAFEQALNRTMQPNLWPSMNGGGVEQVGATQACNDLFLQSVGGSLRFFPGWEPGAAVSFDRLRTIGAFLVSATRDASGGVHGVSIVSEVGGGRTLQHPDRHDTDSDVPGYGDGGGGELQEWQLRLRYKPRHHLHDCRFVRAICANTRRAVYGWCLHTSTDATICE